MSAERMDRYSNVSLFLHWTIAVLVLSNVFVGGALEDARGPDRAQIFGLHIGLGVSVLLLTLVRLGWRAANPAPPIPEGTPRWQRVIARITHVAFYGLLIGVPLAGWIMVSASPRNPQLELFGVIPWFQLPIPDSAETAKGFNAVHKNLVKVFYLVLALHVAGALKHHFIDKDTVLHRMLPFVPKRGG